MEGARTDFHVIGLQDNAALRGPVVLHGENEVLKRRDGLIWHGRSWLKISAQYTECLRAEIVGPVEVGGLWDDRCSLVTKNHALRWRMRFC